MICRTLVAAAVFGTTSLTGVPVSAQYADGGIKIGILTDMSGGYSDLAGRGSVTAAQLAVEDFGRTINGRKIELIFADHQTLLPRSRAAGSIPKASTQSSTQIPRSRVWPCARSRAARARSTSTPVPVPWR
jgi:hypothetical protein